jgi:KaiC/GvpD/RAD55 family RecA-like ATPase
MQDRETTHLFPFSIVFASLTESERVKTGIKDLNELADGGLPKVFSFLLLGGAGTGKITFRVQSLCKGATKYRESDMYVIFDEPPYSISDHRQGYGWNLGEEGR